MKIIINSIIPFKGFTAINLLGVIFCRPEFAPLNNITLNHESIHTKQMKELLYLFFYLFYGIEWFIKLLFYRKNSYRNISFEREAYSREYDYDYLSKRKPFAWIKLIL